MPFQQGINWASPSPVNITALSRPKSSLNHWHSGQACLYFSLSTAISHNPLLPLPPTRVGTANTILELGARAVWEIGLTCGHTSTSLWWYIVLKGLPSLDFVFLFYFSNIALSAFAPNVLCPWNQTWMHGGKAKLATSSGRAATMPCSDPAPVTKLCNRLKLVEPSSSFPWDEYFPIMVPSPSCTWTSVSLPFSTPA